MRNSAVGRVLSSALIAITAVAVTVAPVRIAAAGNDEPPPPPVTVNEFIPEDRDLSDCISSIPKPGCGSDARGGWRQGLVLGLVLTGMAVIGWRVAVAVRRRDAALNATVSDADADVRTSDQSR